MNDENFDPWVLTGFTTENLRDAAQGLREALPKIEVPRDRRDANSTMLMQAIEGLCIAADHIDRIGQKVAPAIQQIAIHGSEETLDLYGLDSKGHLWQYSFGSADFKTGWVPLPGGVAGALEDNVTPIDKGKH